MTDQKTLANITRVFAQTLTSEKVSKLDAATIASALLCGCIDEIAQDNQDAAIELVLSVILPTLMEASGIKATLISSDTIDGDEDDLPPEGTTLN